MPVTRKQNEILEHMAARMCAMVGGTSPIVYRDPAHTSLAMAFLSTAKFEGRVKMEYLPDHAGSVIATSCIDDNRRIRRAVGSLFAQLTAASS